MAHYPFSGEKNLSFHSYRPAEAANLDSQFGQTPPEMPRPLVNLAVETLPTQSANEAAISGMLLAGMNDGKFAGGSSDTLTLASDRRNFEEALRTEFPDKYKLLKDNAKNLRLELCLPPDASLEQIAEKLYKLKNSEISRYDCRQA